MRIVHAIPYFPPANRFGGVPEAVFSLVAAQARQGHEIAVLTTDAGLDSDLSREGLTLQWQRTRTLRAMGDLGGVRILYHPNRWPRMAERHKIFTASFWSEESRLYLPSAIDALHLHEVHIPGYRKIAQIMKTRGARLCLSCHGSLQPPVHRGLKRFLHRVFDPHLRKGWFSDISAYFVLCREEREQLIHCGADERRIAILPHGLPSFDPPFEKLPFPVSHNPEIPTFLYLGRINKAKGVLDAVQAFCGLCQVGYKARLLCCGPDEGALEEIYHLCSSNSIAVTQNAILSQPGIYILPTLSRNCIPTLFSLTDCTICPSPYEAFGLSPVESLLCGVPVIATTTYGCLEHLTEVHDRIQTVSPHDVKTLQDRMMNCRVLVPTDRRTPSNSLLPSWDRIAERVCEKYKADCCD